MTQQVVVEPSREEIRSLVTSGGQLLQRVGARLQADAIENTTQARTAVALLGNMAPAWIKDIRPEKLLAFARLAYSLGLDPVAGECYILHDTFYVSVYGRLKMAQRTGDFEGVSAPRLPTEAEELLYGVKKGDYARVVEVYRKGWRVPAIHCGIVRAAEYSSAKDHLPIKKQPEWMAEKRGIVGAVKKGFPDIDVPTAELFNDGQMQVFDVPPNAPQQLEAPPEIEVSFDGLGEPAPPEGHNDGAPDASDGDTATQPAATAAPAEEGQQQQTI